MAERFDVRFGSLFRPAVAEVLADARRNPRAALVDALDAVLIDMALRLCDENRLKTAARLGISRTTLATRIRQLALRPPGVATRPPDHPYRRPAANKMVERVKSTRVKF